MAFLKKHAEVDNFLVSLVMDHERYMPLVQIMDNIIDGAAELSWKQLEVLGLEVSDAMGSHFCSGVRQGMINALDAADGEAKNLEVLQAFASKLTQNPSLVNQDDIEGIRSNGWSDQTIEDVVGWVSVMKAYATLDQGLGFGGMPQEVFDEMGQGTVGSKGYVAIFNHFVNM